MKTRSFEECCNEVARKYKGKLPSTKERTFQINGWVKEAIELYAQELVDEAIVLARHGYADGGIGYTKEEILNLLCSKE